MHNLSREFIRAYGQNKLNYGAYQRANNKSLEMYNLLSQRASLPVGPVLNPKANRFHFKNIFKYFNSKFNKFFRRKG